MDQSFAGQRQYIHYSVILRPWVTVYSRQSNPRLNHCQGVKQKHPHWWYFEVTQSWTKLHENVEHFVCIEQSTLRNAFVQTIKYFPFFEKLLMTRYWIPKKEKGISKKDLRVWFEVMCPRKNPPLLKIRTTFLKHFSRSWHFWHDSELVVSWV